MLCAATGKMGVTLPEAVQWTAVSLGLGVGPSPPGYEPPGSHATAVLPKSVSRASQRNAAGK